VPQLNQLFLKNCFIFAGDFLGICAGMHEVIRILCERKAFCFETSGYMLLGELNDCPVIDSNFKPFFLCHPPKYPVSKNPLLHKMPLSNPGAIVRLAAAFHNLMAAL
jgi:hypothetical protein